MEPIIVKSQLTFEQYVKVRRYFSRRRSIKINFIVFIVLLSMIFFTTSADNGRYQTMFAYAVLYFLCYILIDPISNWVVARSNFKKIKWLEEPKTYIFTEDKINVESQSINVTMDWSNIDRVIERKMYFLAITSVKGIYFLPKEGFSLENERKRFRALIKIKGIQNDFKN